MTIETGIVRGHVIALTAAAWGHAKCACVLLAKIVRYRSVNATMFIGAPLYERATKELDAQFIPEVEDDMRRLIRVVPLEIGPNAFENSLLNANFMKEYEKLLNSKRVPFRNELPMDMVEPGPPQLVILDFFLHEILKNIRGVSGYTVPVYALQSASVAAVLFMFGPPEIGGVYSNMEEELNAIPRTDPNIIKKSSGRLIKIPGLPPMYDHERAPQNFIFPENAAPILAKAYKFFMECDGAVMNTDPMFEAPSIKVFEEWFSGRPVISVGPIDFPLIPRREVESQTSLEVRAFLDSALHKYGSRSVVYVSFGSIFWPSEIDKLRAVFEVLIEERVPFIFAHASPFGAIPDDMKERIETSGLAYSSNWLPQTTILNHEACGWFVTHCGHNSVTEALSAGIPLVCWPFDADQPMNAANIATVHNLGYELFEVRSGIGLLPIHRLGGKTPEASIESVKREFSGTLQKMRGQDGAVKRANAQKFRDGFAKLWAPGGENWDGIKKITDILQ
ncbi:UDP-Glycosyltransferase/glycogen phosphorylase [Fomitiporia mediterranea MF3/22]|uniref:UDP-Glycosyltransferase/glycogen phosphorylase n=1 Tax=Fomitiporia mediterranea (strain MF3/22) TaxID=694068 RepID=R7SJM3_FOMME|nr:UDP-Glycosyltransferase/glycogen phosphorylase [Fomitiporia mediterranea MF3/22]EJC97779.1 UDP-Glycosyltransferase/glycogen phosphorylase [Fomitiporia mediterranea MF3/22]